MADRIAEEVGDHLADPDRVNVEKREIVWCIEDERDALALRRGPERFDRFPEQNVRIGRLAVEWQFSGLGKRNGPQVLDQPLEDARFLDQPGNVLVIGFVDPVGNGFQVAPQDRQWRPQFVTDVGQERATLVLIRGQTGRHRIEGPGQFAELAGTPIDLGYPCRVIARFDPSCGIDQRPDRRCQAAEPAHQSDDGEDQDDERDAREWPRQDADRAEHGREHLSHDQHDRDQREEHGQTDDAADRRPHAVATAHCRAPIRTGRGPRFVVGPPRWAMARRSPVPTAAIMHPDHPRTDSQRHGR